MNDVLVSARAAVVSKLLVIAPYSADSSAKPSAGVSQGEKPGQSGSANYGSAGLLRRAQPVAIRLLTTNSDQDAKAVITSAAFVESGAKRSSAFRPGLCKSVITRKTDSVVGT